MNMGPVDYQALATPPEYKCSKCGATGVKLWRQYQTFAEHIQLLCGDCALADQKKLGPLAVDGTRLDGGVWTDQIGWLVAAVPTEEGDTYWGDTYWGYTSVPIQGVEWWKRLPLKEETR